MSQVFVPSAEGFVAQALEAERYLIAPGDEGTLRLLAFDGPSLRPEAVLLLRVPGSPEGTDASWAALTGRSARALLNGAPLSLGIALLRHRDELRLPNAGPLYFSSERLATVEPCARDDAPRCPRCAHPIARGQPAVRCPGCGVLHHQLADRPCWTHLPRCALCDQATDPEAGLCWTPEGF